MAPPKAVDREFQEAPPYRGVQHSDDIMDICLAEGKDFLVITSGRDGSVRLWR